MRQRPSAVIGIISIDAGDYAADKRRMAGDGDDRHFATTIERLAQTIQDTAFDHCHRFASEGRQDLLTFPRTHTQRETILRAAHLARLSADLACELAAFRLQLADFDSDGSGDAAAA